MTRLRDIPCIRLTPAGVITIEFRIEGREVKFWEEYNRRYRADNALLVSDEIRSIGGFADAETVAAIIKQKGIASWPKSRV